MHKFYSVDDYILSQALCFYMIGFSGSVKWEIKLEGRIECSAAILGDFSQVLLYFIVCLHHFILPGNISN